VAGWVLQEEGPKVEIRVRGSFGSILRANTHTRKEGLRTSRWRSQAVEQALCGKVCSRNVFRQLHPSPPSMWVARAGAWPRAKGWFSDRGNSQGPPDGSSHLHCKVPSRSRNKCSLKGRIWATSTASTEGGLKTSTISPTLERSHSLGSPSVVPGFSPTTTWSGGNYLTQAETFQFSPETWNLT
jgi:hypothetical protein